jgi:periplasmic divalent cation tolerance protein
MPIIVHTCCGNETEAEHIAYTGVSRDLAACAHVERITSVFRWEGEIKQADEWKVSFKTADGGFDKLAEMIRQNHSYDEPAIYATAITRTTSSYLDWIETNSHART